MTLTKNNFIIILAFSISFILIFQTFLVNSNARLVLPLFFIIGASLGLLRLFVNHNIKKMKGQPIYKKIAFFAVLLGIGLPFQTWFRVNVLYTIDPNVLPRCIALLVSGMLVLTFILKSIKDKQITN